MPCEPSLDKLKSLQETDVNSGRYLTGIPIVPPEFVKMIITDNGDVKEDKFVVCGRKIPVTEIRRKLLKREERFMRPLPDCASMEEFNLLTSFKSTGIWPFNPDAIDYTKIESSKSSPVDIEEETPESMPSFFSDDTSDVLFEVSNMPKLTQDMLNSLPGCSKEVDISISMYTQKENMTPSAIALRALESTLNKVQLILYRQRVEEGYDVQTDAVFVAWKSLKLAVEKEETDRLQRITDSCKNRNTTKGSI